MENWVNIKYLEGYQVSNLGRVKSLKRKEKILKTGKDGYGYPQVVLYNGKPKTYKIHRLVWEAFNGEIPEGMQINHINEDKTDNRLDNLELVTPKENCNWGTRNEKITKALSKHTLQFNLNGELINEWISASEAARQLGIDQRHISGCCMGERKSAYGYIWKYKEVDC